MNDIRVLIVDDLPQVRQGLATVLELIGRKTGLGIEIIGEAQSGIEAIEKAQLLHPEVVLMDLEMPGMDGWAAAQNIKLIDPSIFVVALTIHDDLAARQKANQVGMDAFVEKGAPLEELIRAIKESRRFRSRDELGLTVD